MSDIVVPFGLLFLALFVLYGSRFPLDLLKYNANLLVSFLASWLAHDWLESRNLLERTNVPYVAADCISFFLVNLAGILMLRTGSLLLQVIFALFQLEVSRILIAGSSPDIRELVDSGAYLFVLSAAASALVARALPRKRPSTGA